MPNDLTSGAIPAAIYWLVASIRSNYALMALASDIVSFPHEADVRYPAIGFSMQHATTTGAVGGVNVLAPMLFTVVGVTMGTDITDLTPISKLIHDTIHDMFNAPDGSTPYGVVTSCTFMDPVWYTYKDDEKKTWQYLGGTYAIVAQ